MRAEFRGRAVCRAEGGGTTDPPKKDGAVTTEASPATDEDRLPSPVEADERSDHRAHGCPDTRCPCTCARVRGSTSRDRGSAGCAPRRRASRAAGCVGIASTARRRHDSTHGAPAAGRCVRSLGTPGRGASRSRWRSSVTVVRVVRAVALLLFLLFFTREKVEKGLTGLTSPLPHWHPGLTASLTAP